MIQKCKQCGKTFELTDSEIAFFNRKGLDLPKRCEACRRQNRKNQRNDEPTMPGIRQVREVDPGFHHAAPASGRKNRQWKRYDDETPFWKQETQAEAERHPVTAFIILLVIVICVVAGGLILAIRHARPTDSGLNMSRDAAQLVQEVTTVSVPEPTSLPVREMTTAAVPETTVQEVTTTAVPETTKPDKEVTYYLNTYRMKFHRPDCESVYQMNAKNRKAFYGTREEAIDMGYSPCNNCKP